MALTKLQPFNLNTAGNYSFGSLQAAGNLTANGNIFGTYIIGNGSLLTGINTNSANLINGNSNVLVAANGNITMSVSGTSNVLVLSSDGLTLTGNANVGNLSATVLEGTLKTNSQPNITSVGILTSLSVNGNIVALNANLGNLVTSNYLVSESGCIVVGTGAIAVQSNVGGIFNSSVSSINIGLGANSINFGSGSSNVVVNNDLSANGTVTAANATISNAVTAEKLIVGDLYSKRTAVPVTTNTVIDSFSISEYRAAKYIIKVNSDLGYQAVESLLVHDDINSMITIYASLTTAGVDLITLTTSINDGNVQLLATALASNTNVNIMGTYVPD